LRRTVDFTKSGYEFSSDLSGRTDYQDVIRRRWHSLDGFGAIKVEKECS
jgi:hypothetical protein